MSVQQTARPTVPFLDLHGQYHAIRDEILAAIVSVCDSQRFILGPEVEALERELAGFIGSRHGVAVSSGTDALLAVLMALGVGPGDEVITSTFSFFASASSARRLGARCVLVDIDPGTMNLDVGAVEAAITPRTRAIVPVHLFGLSVDIDSLAAVAGNRPIVEDACQAVGAACHGRSVGTLGTAACFSFYPSKNLGGFGDGGFVTTMDGALAGQVRRLRHHGQDGPYYHTAVGGNFRLDALQAAVLRVKLRYLSGWNDARRRRAASYARLFEAHNLTDVIRLPIEPAGLRHVYHQYVIRTARRDALKAHLESHGIGTAVYYPVPLHRQPCFSDFGYAAGDFPQAERAAEEALALPIYPELTDDQQAHIVHTIDGFFHA
jgi:dTDP-4-amino-4,6-dideoxygalactose transaminase